MSADTGEIDAPGGTVRLRPARQTDEAFQFDLFRAHRIGILQRGGLPREMIETLLTMQYRSRTPSYREKFPGARWSIIEAAGEPIGELIEHDEADAIYIVDIALRPERQRRGIGGAVIGSIMERSASRGGVRALAHLDNEASLRMFRRLGFVETLDEGGASIELRWRPSAAASAPAARPDRPGR